MMTELAAIFLSLLLTLQQQRQPPPQPTASQIPHTLKKRVFRTVTGKYLLYLPRDYFQSKKRFPLIMYLHGGSMRGDDVEKLRTVGLTALLEKDRSFPFVVISPLCPGGEIWTDTEMLIGILDEVLGRYRINRDRVYLTGHSMGGRGALYLAYKYPDRFAAIAPLSPYSTISFWAGRLKGVPVWMIHGARDEIVPLSEAEAMAEALKQAGGELKFTVLQDRDHFILDTYEDKQLYQWLLLHKRQSSQRQSK
jgi:predicted peptidase